MTELKRWEEDGQRFYDTPIGKLPSYTTVEGVLSKPWLTGWAVKKTAEKMRVVLKSISSGNIRKKDLTAKRIDELVKEAKAQHGKQSDEAKDIGSAVHGWIEEYYGSRIGVGVHDNRPPIPDAIRNPVDAFLQWDCQHWVLPLCVEERIWSDKRYAGTLDLYAGVDGSPTLVDFKSSTGHYESNVIQLGAYSAAFQERTGNPIERYLIVRLDKKTGMPDPKEYSKEEVEIGRKKFMCLLEYWWLEYGDKVLA